MARIVSIVLNSVKRDIRVLKQAESLKKQGHEMIIVGVRDTNVSTTAHEILDNGVEVYRPPWRADTQRQLALLEPLYVTSLLVTVFLGLWLIVSAFGNVGGTGGADWLAAWDVTSGEFWRANSVSVGVAAALTTLVAVLAPVVTASRRAAARFRATERYEELKAIGNPGALPVRPYKPTRVPRYVFSVLSRPLDFAEHGRVLRLMLREREFARFVERLEPDIVHCHDLFTLAIGVTLKRKQNCTLVFDAHEMYDQLAQTSDKEADFNRHSLRLFASEVDRFITINDSIAAYYARLSPFLPPAVVVKNATVVSPPVQYDGRLHKAAGLPPGRKILLYQGGFARRRGLEALVQSSRLLKPEWSIVMMGWGSHEQPLRRLAFGNSSEQRKIAGKRFYVRKPSQLTALPDTPESPFLAGRDSRIRFIPPAPQHELLWWTAGATVGIIPYEDVSLNHWFCSPNKLWEYPAAGVPLIVNPFPELRRAVEENQIGWLLPDRLSPQGIAETVNALTDEEISAARANCIPYIQRDNWDVYVQRLLLLYQDIVEKN